MRLLFIDHHDGISRLGVLADPWNWHGHRSSILDGLATRAGGKGLIGHQGADSTQRLRLIKQSTKNSRWHPLDAYIAIKQHDKTLAGIR